MFTKAAQQHNSSLKMNYAVAVSQARKDEFKENVQKKYVDGVIAHPTKNSCRILARYNQRFMQRSLPVIFQDTLQVSYNIFRTSW